MHPRITIRIQHKDYGFNVVTVTWAGIVLNADNVERRLSLTSRAQSDSSLSMHHCHYLYPVYTIQPVAKPVVQPVVKPVVQPVIKPVIPF